MTSNHSAAHTRTSELLPRCIAGLVLGLLVLLPVPAAAQGRTHVPAAAHAKLDPQLNAAVASKTTRAADVIIEFHDDSIADAVVRRNGGKVGRRLDILRARVAKVPTRMLPSLADDPRVKAIHLDRPAHSTAGRTAVTVGARAVQELMGYTGAGVGIAVIDSGITGWHDDLSVVRGTGQRIAQFVDFVNGQSQLYDDQGHGTHVAGIIAGNGFDSAGLRNAIAPGSHLVALKALDSTGAGNISNVIAAIDYAVANQAAFNIRVINLSLGAGVYESYNTDPLTLAAKRAVDAGMVVVAAAGNLGDAADGNPQYGAILSPGNAPWVITVGASSTMGTVIRQDDTIAGYSSRGPTMYDYAAKPDLVAPGTGTVSLSDPISRLYSTQAELLLGGTRATSYLPYLALSGTSMSAPVVSGSIALMLQANPALSPNLVKAILQFSAQQYPGYDPLTQGAGFLNTRGAVILAEYLRTGRPGEAYPAMTGWSRQIFWGNKRVSGGVIAPGGTAWTDGVVWGAPATPSGTQIVWGDNCLDASCDNAVWGKNIVWGNSGDDNIVWGNDGDDNIVWGNSNDDNIVWGNNDEDNIVWGNSGDDNIVWGNDCGGEDCDNIVWGNSDADNIVWGNAEDVDNIVWGNSADDNIVWGNRGEDNIVWGNSGSLTVTFGVEQSDVHRLPSTIWDALFPLDAQMPSTTATVPATSTQPTVPTPTRSIVPTKGVRQ